MFMKIPGLLIILVVSTLGRHSLAAVADGTVLYQQNCAVCHGSHGDGGVGVPLNLPDFLAVASDDYLRNTLHQGRPGRVMPAFPALSDNQAEAIITHIRGWSDQPAPVYVKTPLKGDADQGRTLFAKHCAACHGERGQGGSGTGVTFSRPRESPVMAPALNNSGFQDSVSDAMLKATLLQGREGTPMPAIAALGLGEQDANDLVAWVRTLQGGRRQQAVDVLEPVIQFESSYTLEETLENLKQAIMGRNFRIIRVQYFQEGLVSAGEEDPTRVMLYFCNFSFLDDALAIDPRVGLFLPCRITLVDTGQGVQVMSINPNNLSRLFNNAELDKACQEMHDIYVEIMEDATL